MARFEQLLVEQIPRLRRYARALSGDPALADDLVQDTLVRALTRRHLWMSTRGIRPWLFTIMHNVYVNAVVRRARVAERSAGPEELGQVPSAERAESDLQLRELDRALATLPAEQREALLLASLEGLSYREIAKVAAVPIGTVMSRVSRARERLRQLVQGRGDAPLRRIK